MHEHFRARFDLQLLASVHGQRSGAASTADNQPDRRAFAATGNTPDDRAHSRSNSGALDRLIGPAFRFDSAFFVSAARTLAIDPGHVPVQHSSSAIAQLD